MGRKKTNNNIGTILANAGAVPANTGLSSPYIEQIHIREPAGDKPDYENLTMNLDISQEQQPQPQIPNLDDTGKGALEYINRKQEENNMNNQVANQQAIPQQGQVVYQQPITPVQPQPAEPGIFDRVTSTISENKGAIFGAAAGAAAMYLFTSRDTNEAAEAFNSLCDMV